MKLCKNKSGATAVEYAVIAGLLFLVIVTAVTSLSGSVSSTYSTIASQVPNL